MTEEQKQINIGEMLRVTGANTAEFMKQVADQFDMVINHIAELKARIQELEGTPRDPDTQ